MKFTAIYKDGAFVPSNYSDKEKLKAKYKNGDIVQLTETNPRSLKQHGYFFKFLQVCVDLGFLDRNHDFDYISISCDKIRAMQAVYKDDIEVVRKVLAIGFLPLVESINGFGEVDYLPGSIAFVEKNKEEFTNFFQQCKDYICFKFKVDEKLIDEMIRGIDE